MEKTVDASDLFRKMMKDIDPSCHEEILCEMVDITLSSPQMTSKISDHTPEQLIGMAIADIASALKYIKCSPDSFGIH